MQRVKSLSTGRSHVSRPEYRFPSSTAGLPQEVSGEWLVASGASLNQLPTTNYQLLTSFGRPRPHGSPRRPAVCPPSAEKDAGLYDRGDRNVGAWHRRQHHDLFARADDSPSSAAVSGP